MEKVYLVEVYLEHRMNDELAPEGFRKIYRTSEEAFKFAKARIEYFSGWNDSLPEDAKLQDGLFVYEFEHEFSDTVPYAEISIEEFEVHGVEELFKHPPLLFKNRKETKKMWLYDSQNHCIEKLFEEHAELVDANLLEGEDPDISAWLKKRHKLIKKFDKKLRKVEDPEDYLEEVTENMVDFVCRLIFGE